MRERRRGGRLWRGSKWERISYWTRRVGEGAVMEGEVNLRAFDPAEVCIYVLGD